MKGERIIVQDEECFSTFNKTRGFCSKNIMKVVHALHYTTFWNTITCRKNTREVWKTWSCRILCLCWNFWARSDFIKCFTKKRINTIIKAPFSIDPRDVLSTWWIWKCMILLFLQSRRIYKIFPWNYTNIEGIFYFCGMTIIIRMTRIIILYLQFVTNFTLFLGNLGKVISKILCREYYSLLIW